MSDRGISYRHVETGAPPCAADPDGWDLDAIGHDPLAIQAAMDACRDCHMLTACMTQALTHRPLGAVQAGRTWPESGRSYKRGRRAS